MKNAKIDPKNGGIYNRPPFQHFPLRHCGKLIISIGNIASNMATAS
jgi:hypothetical protein